MQHLVLFFALAIWSYVLKLYCKWTATVTVIWDLRFTWDLLEDLLLGLWSLLTLLLLSEDKLLPDFLLDPGLFFEMDLGGDCLKDFSQLNSITDEPVKSF